MKPSLAVTVFACADRDLRGFSFKHDGSDLPPRADGGLWIAIATIPMSFVELEKYTSDPATVLANLQEYGSHVAPTTAKILHFPTPHRGSA
jgi:hypothetical protein